MIDFNAMRRVTSKATIILGDLNALQRGRLGERIANRVIGRLVGKATRRL